jgi:D-aminoacyl-tRNA deacylase
MRAVIQRVAEAQVRVAGETIGSIARGLLLFVGFEPEDSTEDLLWTANKIAQMRIFTDEAGLMNLSVQDIGGQILVISQFTLHASTKKGNRPSFVQAARPEQAIPLYEDFKKQMSLLLGKPVQSGQFGANMQVSLVNDGPVTIWIDSKNKS